MIRFLCFPFLLLAGCSDSALSNELAPADDSSTRLTGNDDTGVEDDDTSAPPAPAWYVVRADLGLTNGAPVADGATVTVDVIDADLERVNCIVELAVDGIVATAVDGADATTVWWEVPVAPLEAPCATLPDELLLGVGAMHPDVRARLGSVGNDDIADSLYGAYLALDGEVAAFGYAGTASDLLGDDVAVVPPPDGLYRLSPLYLVPLPE